MHCAHSGLFNFKYYVIRYCGYSSALAVLGVLYWGYCQYVPAILISPFQHWFYWNYVVSVRYNEKNGWLIAGNNKPTKFKVGTVRTCGKRYIC